MNKFLNIFILLTFSACGLQSTTPSADNLGASLLANEIFVIGIKSAEVSGKQLNFAAAASSQEDGILRTAIPLISDPKTMVVVKTNEKHVIVGMGVLVQTSKDEISSTLFFDLFSRQGLSLNVNTQTKAVVSQTSGFVLNLGLRSVSSIVESKYNSVIALACVAPNSLKSSLQSNQSWLNSARAGAAAAVLVTAAACSAPSLATGWGIAACAGAALASYAAVENVNAATAAVRSSQQAINEYCVGK